jgi:hypothetical protein
MSNVIGSIFGGSSGGSGASQSSSQADPRVIQGYIDNLNRQNQMIGNLPGIQYAGFTPDELAGFAATRANAYAGAPALDLAAQRTAALGTYQPISVGSMQVGPAFTGATGYGAAQNLGGGNFLQSNLGAYMNPYTQQVVDTTLADLERGRQLAQQDVGAAASRAGAFGGSRQGVAEAETNRAFAEQAAQTAAQLRQAGFTQAAGMAESDLARQLQAGLANQEALNLASQFGAGAVNQAALANQQAAMQAQQLNQDAMLRAALANQQAGLQGAQLGLSAAEQLGSLGQMQQQFGLTGAAALGDIGATQRDLQQQQANAYRDSVLQQLALYNAAVGASPGTFSTSSTGSTKGKSIWETIFG